MSIQNPKTDLESVIRFHIKSDIILTSKQEELWIRLSFADSLMRSRKYSRDDVILRLRNRFKELSVWRANQDIADAHKLFGETRKINKGYLLSHHIEEIGMQIQLMKEQRKFDLLPKLNDNYTYALNSLPTEIEQPDNSPSSVQFILNGTAIDKQAAKDLLTLLTEADNYIKHGASQYIPFEIVPGPEEENNHHGAERTADGSSAGAGE